MGKWFTSMKKGIYQGLQDEYDYCQKMVKANHKSPHWAIRIDEITKQFMKGTKNGKRRKIRKRLPIRGTKK